MFLHTGTRRWNPGGGGGLFVHASQQQIWEDSMDVSSTALRYSTLNNNKGM